MIQKALIHRYQSEIFIDGYMLEPRDVNHAAMSFQQNLRLLSFLLKGNHKAAGELLRDGAGRPDNFIYFVEQHWLQLLVFPLLNGSPMRQVLPQQWFHELKSFALSHWARQEALVRELMAIANVFAAAGQEFILLKGAYLASRFFGGIDRRPFFDIDVLVSKDALSKAQRLLTSNGYIRKSGILFNEALTTYFTHAFDFVKPNVALDLHWNLSANAAHHLDYDAIWRQRQNFVLYNRNFSVLSDEYEVVFSLISIFKDLERGAARLKTFVDLYFILNALESKLDWDSFVENRRREKILRISVNVLALFLDLFDCREHFASVAQLVGRQQILLKRVSAQDSAALLEASIGSIQNKLWTAEMYDCSRLQLFLWWLISLPFRLAVHDHAK
jgi:Uncharacterised nucleotidyltransferase